MNSINEYITTQGELIVVLRELANRHIKKQLSDEEFEMAVEVYLKQHLDKIFNEFVKEQSEIRLRQIIYARLGKKRMMHINNVIRKKMGYLPSENNHLIYRKNFAKSENAFFEAAVY